MGKRKRPLLPWKKKGLCFGFGFSAAVLQPPADFTLPRQGRSVNFCCKNYEQTVNILEPPNGVEEGP
jgi:hypothetical protein